MDSLLHDILIPEEVVEHEYQLEKGTSMPRLTVTNTRCILWRPQMDVVSEFEKTHLSSIDYRLWDYWIFGLIFICVGLLASLVVGKVFDTHEWVAWLVAGIGLTGIALLFRREEVTFWVTGRQKPLTVTRKFYLWQNNNARLRSLLAVARLMTRAKERALDRQA